MRAGKSPGELGPMTKVSKTAAKLEAMVLAALRRAPHCQGVSSVTVERVDETRFNHTWGVSYIGGDVEPLACEVALKEILASPTTPIRPDLWRLICSPMR